MQAIVDTIEDLSGFHIGIVCSVRPTARFVQSAERDVGFPNLSRVCRSSCKDQGLLQGMQAVIPPAFGQRDFATQPPTLGEILG